jgi:hypothetical protein
MSHWTHITESLVKFNAGDLALPGKFASVCGGSRSSYARNLTFFLYKHKYSFSVYFVDSGAVYPVFLPAIGRAKSCWKLLVSGKFFLNLKNQG